MSLMFDGKKITFLNELANYVPHINLLSGTNTEFYPINQDDPENIDQYEVYKSTSIHLVKGETYTVSAKTNGIFTDIHDTSKPNDNCVIRITTSNEPGIAIISDANTSTGTTFTWNKNTGDYCVRINKYGKNSKVKVWDLKIEKGTTATPWTPSPEDL